MPNDEHAPTESHLHLSEGFKGSAKGAVKTAAEILCIAASTTQSVPYLGIVSSALTELLKIQDEVNTYKSDWKAVIGVAQQIKAVVDKVHKQCRANEQDNTVLPQTLTEPLTELERCIGKVLETLNASEIEFTRLKDRVRMYLGRGELSNEVKQCRAEMQAALDLFNTQLNIDGHFERQAIKTILIGLDDKQPSTLTPAAPALLPVFLPPAPAVFHGRAGEVDHVVDLLLHKAPARVAVLGSGGIGKTSIALTVLHHPDVTERYVNQRFFLSCEATPRAEDVVQELLKMFGVAYEPKSGAQPLNALISHLRTLPDGILCLDNMETPWDADVDATQTLLSRIADTSRLALLITTRGMDRPMRVAWTRPFPPPIAPLTLEAALETWNSICDSHDEFSQRLVQAVDCVPLAVTLLAHLAESESSQRLWTRWERELTELLRVRGPDNRLNSVDVSIQLSLMGPRLRDDAQSVHLLSVICTLPQGMLESRVPAFEGAFREQLPKLNQSITVLKQCSLVYSSEGGFLRVLSPIRHYVQAHHPITDPLLACLADIYCHLVSIFKDDFASDIIYSDRNIWPEIGNITAVLDLCLAGDRQRLEQTLFAVSQFMRLCRTLSLYDDFLLSKAIARAELNFPELRADLWRLMGECLHFTDRGSESLAAFIRAAELFRSLGDRSGEARTLSRTSQTLRHLGRAEEAELPAQSALELYDSHVEDQRGKAGALHNLGVLSARAGRTDEALYMMQFALDLYRETAYEVGEANSLKYVSYMQIRLGQLNEAEDSIQSARDIYERIGERLGKATCLKGLETIYRHLGRLDEAERTLQLALTQHRQTNNQLSPFGDLYQPGIVYQRLRRYEDSPVRNSSTSSQYTIGQGNARLQLGHANRASGRFDEARRCYQDALCLYEQAQGPYNVGIAREALDNLGGEVSQNHGEHTDK